MVPRVERADPFGRSAPRAKIGETPPGGDGDGGCSLFRRNELLRLMEKSELMRVTPGDE